MRKLILRDSDFRVFENGGNPASKRNSGPRDAVDGCNESRETDFGGPSVGSHPETFSDLAADFHLCQAVQRQVAVVHGQALVCCLKSSSSLDVYRLTISQEVE